MLVLRPRGCTRDLSVLHAFYAVENRGNRPRQKHHTAGRRRNGATHGHRTHWMGSVWLCAGAWVVIALSARHFTCLVENFGSTQNANTVHLLWAGSLPSTVHTIPYVWVGGSWRNRRLAGVTHEQCNCDEASSGHGPVPEGLRGVFLRS